MRKIVNFVTHGDRGGAPIYVKNFTEMVEAQHTVFFFTKGQIIDQFANKVSTVQLTPFRLDSLKRLLFDVRVADVVFCHSFFASVLARLLCFFL